MANLFLRRGPLARLADAPKVDGAISFTTDEPGIYLDILEGSEVVRKRIGDLIQVPNIDALVANYNQETGAMTGIATSAQGLVSEWSESALYYAIEENALLKYVKSTSSWVQVNTVGDLPARMTAVEGKVASLEGTVGNATSGLVKKVADLESSVSDNADAIAGHATDIEALKSAVGMDDEGNVEGLAGSVAQLRTDLGELETEVHGQDGNGGMKATLADHAGKITALEQASAQHVTKTEAAAFAKTADIQPTLNKVDTEGTVSAAIEDAVATEKSRAEGVEKTLSDSIAAVKSTADNAVQTTTFNQFKTENTAAIATAKTEAINDATTAANGYTDSQIAAEVTRANGAYAPKSLVDTVSGHTGTLTTLTGDATVQGSVAEAKKAAEDAMAEAQKKTTMAEVEAKDYATKTQAKAYADAKDAAIQAAADAAADAQGDIDAWETAHANDYTNTKIDELVADAKKAGTDAQADFDAYETAHASDYTNKQIDDKITAASNSASGAQGAADAAQEAADAAQADATKALTAIGDADSGLTKAVNDNTAALEILNGAATVSGSVAEAKKAGTDAAATANANSGEIATLKGQVATLNGNAQTAGSVDYKVAQAKSALESKIEEEINAANAMDYQKGIGAQSELNAITQAKAGDTYVVTSQFGTYYPGDLLIATGTEGSDGFISGDISWTHVKTGYDASLEQTLSGADNKIKLSSITGANNGEVAFEAAANTSASVSVAGNKVVVGMVWGEF